MGEEIPKLLGITTNVLFFESCRFQTTQTGEIDANFGNLISAFEGTMQKMEAVTSRIVQLDEAWKLKNSETAKAHSTCFASERRHTRVTEGESLAGAGVPGQSITAIVCLPRSKAVT